VFRFFFVHFRNAIKNLRKTEVHERVDFFVEVFAADED
jgi:hypothetical protein